MTTQSAIYVRHLYDNEFWVVCIKSKVQWLLEKYKPKLFSFK